MLHFPYAILNYYNIKRKNIPLDTSKSDFNHFTTTLMIFKESLRGSHLFPRIFQLNNDLFFI